MFKGRIVVTLCGSTKFKAEFERANLKESLGGKIVHSVCGFMHADNLSITKAQKEELDELHLAKIDMSDEILVIAPGGYVGESTKQEIEYAKITLKGIRYWGEKKGEIIS